MYKFKSSFIIWKAMLYCKIGIERFKLCIESTYSILQLYCRIFAGLTELSQGMEGFSLFQ